MKQIFKKEMVKKKEGCIVHIRGGDFVKLGWNSITPKNYFMKAIRFAQERKKLINFYVVTDDREYAKTLLDGIDFKYELVGGSIQEDFYLISSFNIRILSSSAFAFWASALGINEKGGIVIAPLYWRPGILRKIFLPNEVMKGY